MRTNVVDLINNTIADNKGRESSGIHLVASGAGMRIFNNIVVAKSGEPAIAGGHNPLDPPVFRSNNVFSPQGVAYAGLVPDQTGLNGNISADPLFVKPSAGDYHLRPGSPSIDSGDNAATNLPSTDFDGNPRIQDGNGDGVAIVDMGAYEASPPFDICIQDDSSGSILRINSTTGDYQFVNCSGFTLSGMGGLIKRGGTITLQHYASDRRVLARIDTSVSKGTASIQVFSQGTTFTITDRNTANNTCVM